MTDDDDMTVGGVRPADRRIMGIHLHLDGQSASKAIERLMAMFPTLKDIQIFTHGPQSANQIRVDPEFKATVARFGLRVWTHGSYLCVPWSAKPFLTTHTIDNIRVSHALGSNCVVAHIPAKPVTEVVAGIVPVVRKMRELGLQSTKLMLENSANRSDPTRSYETPTKMNALTAAICEAKLDDCVRICIDTAHLFTSRAVISTYADAKAWCDALDKRLIGMIQLNGNSISPDTAIQDKHEVPMSPEDLIWRATTWDTAGCRTFIEMGVSLGIPIILEVSKRHSVEAIANFIKLADTAVRPSPPAS